MKKLPPANVSDILGGSNVIGAAMERGDLVQKEKEPGVVKDAKDAKDKDGKEKDAKEQKEKPNIIPPSVLQLRQNISEYIGIPLGSKYAREKIVECIAKDKNEKNNQLNFFLFYGNWGRVEKFRQYNQINIIFFSLSLF